MLYVPCESSFISTEFFVLNLGGSLVYENLLLFDIRLLDYYINFRSSVIRCIFSGGIYIFSLIFLPQVQYFPFICNCPWTILWWSAWDFSNFISNFVANQIISCICCFTNCSFWSSFKCVFSRLFSMRKTFLTVFRAYVFNIILLMFLFILLGEKYCISRVNWIKSHFLFTTLQLIT